MTTDTKTAPMIANPDDYAAMNRQRLWRIDALYASVPCFVFATNPQEALDIVVDETTFLNHLKIEECDDSEEEEDRGRLGNYCELFETEHIRCTEIGPAPTTEELVSAWVASLPA